MAASDKYSKTEPPTPKRRREARQEGKVARSPEVAGWFGVLIGSLLLPWLFSTARSRVLDVTGAAANVMAHPSAGGALAVLEGGLREFLLYILAAGSAFMAIGVVANLAQVGRAASFKAARPRLTRISPKAGLRRLFSPAAGWGLAKELLKLGLLAVLGYSSLKTIVQTLGGKAPVSLSPVLGYAGSSILTMVRTIAIVGLALGLADYAVQRHRLNNELKMTKQEVKDERRQQEGDPMVKSRLRRQQYAIARSRIMAAVKTADLVVTNPTHFAVALQYDPKRGSAPRVVAKGVDLLAARIRDEAARQGVPVVEDPPLARYLHAVCDVEQQVPVAVYVAVARLIAFVYSLSPAARRAGVHRRPWSLVPEVASVAPRRRVAGVSRAPARAIGAPGDR